MKASALFVILVSALSATLSAQIPERAQWEITFAQVEASAGLSEMRTAPPEMFEARLMERPWSATDPLPFLRIVRGDGILRAQLFVFFGNHSNFVPDRRPKGPDVLCRDGICVKPINLLDQLDWKDVVASLANQNACPPKNPDVVTVCGDCEQIWIKTVADGRYREQSCQMPGVDTAAGALLELMKKSARAAGY
jgi:hypothetical protein